jgi:ribosomal protein L11 methyltransferase
MRLGDTYYWLRFRSEPTTREWDEFRLFECGAMGIEEQSLTGEPIHPDLAGDQPLWLKASFEEQPGFEEACAAFADHAGFEKGLGEVEDWDKTWRDRQEPVAVTGQLTVIPPWLQPPSQGQVIRLTAKMAFGTGLHESTQLAAELLEKLPSQALQGATLLDIGAGTGILALYAAQLGAAYAFAHDNDPVTGPCMAENRVLNPLPSGRHFLGFVGTTEALKPRATFDILVCNMIRTEWWPFKEELVSRTRPGGYLLISGQRLEDKEKVAPWLESQGLSLCQEVVKNGWWAVTAQGNLANT